MMRKWNKKTWLVFVLFCLILSLLSLYPYWLRGVNLEHDTCFHISRIAALAQSFRDGDLLPRIFPYQNNGFGYASPLFYSNTFLVLPALCAMAGLSIARCYQLLLLLCSFFTCFNMGLLMRRVTEKKEAVFLAALLYLLCSYRLTDIYVRGAVGEVVALTFFPIALIGIVEVLYGQPQRWGWLTAGFSALLLSHNISFLLGCLMFLGFLALRIRTLRAQPQRLKAIVKATVAAIGLCAFFLFPMLEQMSAQTLYVHSYASSTHLEDTALNAWQFTTQQMVFGVAGNTLDPSSAMTTNLGWLIPLLPLTGFFLFQKPKEEKSRFVHHCLILGYGLMLLCSRCVPWEYLTWLRVIQFPWRLMAPASVLLSVAAAVIAVEFFGRWRRLGVSCCMIAGLITSLVPLVQVMERSLVLNLDAPYSVLLDGSLLDPSYGDSFFIRTEIAGADYLPVATLDYRTASRAVQEQSGAEISDTILRQGTTTRFELQEHQGQQWLTLPITWYKGYAASGLNRDGTVQELTLRADPATRRVQVYDPSGTIIAIELRYEGTLIQRGSEGLTLISIGMLGWLGIRKKRKMKEKRSEN